MPIRVIVDSREHYLWEILHQAPLSHGNGNGAENRHKSMLRESVTKPVVPIHHEMMPYLEKRMLPVGDVWILEKDGHGVTPTTEDRILMIWERKTIDDLWSSIRDGRYHEQHDRVHRFASALPYDTTYLRVLEGACPSASTASSRFSSMPLDTFFHVCMKTYPETAQKPFVQTIRTYNLRETVHLLFSVWKQFRKSSDPPPGKSSDNDDAGDAGDAHLWKNLSHAKKIPTARQDHITSHFILSCSLAVVPRLSFTNAEKIAKAFGSPALFISEYHQDPIAWKQKIQNSLDKTSTQLITRIESLFFHPDAVI